MADFVLGRLKFKWRGDWSTSTAYLIDDIVKYGGNTYVCIVNHTSQSTTSAFYTDFQSSSYWQLHTEGLFFKGDWAGSTFYKLNDLVRYGTYQYRCILQHTSSSSFAVGSNWQLFTEGLQFEDSYNPATTYQKGDIVTYGGYSYVAAQTTVSGVTPIASASEWDLLNPGFNALGDFSYGTSYKTGDVVKYGGNSYVALINNQNEYPALTTGATNTTYFQLLNEGINWRGSYSAVTSYNINDSVRYVSSSYIMLKDRNTGTTPGTDATVWELVNQGDSGAVLNTRGDLIYQDASGSARLPIGVSGSVLTTNGTDPSWSAPEGSNVIYVANSGSDTNSGTQFQPYKTISKALSVATSGDIVDFSTVTGGTGGVPGTYTIGQLSTTGSGSGSQIRITTDGSSTPTVEIVNGGSGHVAGDVVTFDASGSSASNVSITVVSASVGDVVFVKNGVYRETLPLRIPAGVTVQGETLRGTEIRPASGSSTQIASITSSSTISGATDGTYNYIHQSSTDGSGDGLVVNITIASGAISGTPTIYHGGYGHAVSDQITFTVADIGCGGTGSVVLTVATLEDNNAANMWLMNNTTNLVQMSFKGLTATPIAGGTSAAAVTSLDPEGSITTSSPYVQNCSSINANATGVQIDGNLHSAGNKSILANDFTQINSDGIGVHCLAGGRGEMVSVFTYYCAKSFYAHSGGFIRGLNCSSAYGEKGAVAEGTLSTETPVNITTRGEILKYNSAGFVGAATESDIADMIASSGAGTATLVGVTSGATATIFRVNVALDYLHIESRSGNFTQGETVTITKEDSSTFQVTLDSSTGDSSAAQIGQIGPLIAVSSGTTALTSNSVIKVGTNIKFTGDSTYYRVSLVSEEDIINENALVRLTANIVTADAKADNTSADVTQNFSNVRLTGHDFLDIGTGDIATTNYPGGPSQPADQADEVEETTGGRVYFVSSDQKGDFRVGDLFRIEQATGIATLNADAFDLSGITELQLGSIGAELGATINEFSTDQTLGGDSNSAVPTERAVVGYLTRDNAGTGAWVPPTGTTAQRPTGGNLYTGAIRYNSTLVTWEGYNGSQWTGLGGGNPWQTFTADGSTTLTVAANDRYFIDTTASAQTVTLPASPLNGDQVHLIDLAGTFDTNNLTIGRNGNNIMGAAADMTVAVEHAAVQLVYSGATYGWKLMQNN